MKNQDLKKYRYFAKNARYEGGEYLIQVRPGLIIVKKTPQELYKAYLQHA